MERAIDILNFLLKKAKETIQFIKMPENTAISQPATGNIVKMLVTKNYR